MLKIAFVMILIYLELELLKCQSEITVDAETNETNKSIRQTSLFEISHLSFGETQTKSNEHTLSYISDYPTKSFDYTQLNSSETPQSQSHDYTRVISSETPQSSFYDYTQVISSETPQSSFYDYTQEISSETPQSQVHDYTRVTSSETPQSSVSDYTPLTSSETPQSSSYDYTPLTSSETPQSSSYNYTPLTSSETPQSSVSDYTPLTSSETPQSSSFDYTPLTSSETPQSSSYDYTPLTSSETPQSSSYDYTPLTSGETPRSPSYDSTQVTPSETQPTSFYHIQSTLSEMQIMSDLNSLSTLSEFQVNPHVSIPSTLISTTIITSNAFIRSTLSPTETMSNHYNSSVQSQARTSSTLYTPSTESQSHTTPYQPILSTVFSSTGRNPLSPTPPATTQTSSPRAENIVLVAILSSVAAFLVISFSALTFCLVYRRRKNRRNAPADALPGNVSAHSRRHFHFSYLPNPMFRRSSTESSQPLQTSGKPKQVRAKSSVRSTPSIGTDYSTINGETAFIENNESSATHQRHGKPKSNKLVSGQKVKPIIPSAERLSVVKEEVNDEVPIYAVVNKNRSPNAKPENELSTSNAQNGKDISYGPSSTQVQDKDLDHPQHQTLRNIHTQVPYGEIVWHNSDTDATSTPNQVYSQLRDVERNFKNPYN